MVRHVGHFPRTFFRQVKMKLPHLPYQKDQFTGEDWVRKYYTENKQLPIVVHPDNDQIHGPYTDEDVRGSEMRYYVIPKDPIGTIESVAWRHNSMLLDDGKFVLPDVKYAYPAYLVAVSEI